MQVIMLELQPTSNELPQIATVTGMNNTWCYSECSASSLTYSYVVTTTVACISSPIPIPCLHACIYIYIMLYDHIMIFCHSYSVISYLKCTTHALQYILQSLQHI